MINKLILAITIFYSTTTLASHPDHVDPALFRKIKKYMAPVQTVHKGKLARYCSSSQIEYKGKIYTVTNRHCCDNTEELSGKKGYIIVGGTLVKIIHIAQHADICIANPTKKTGLKVAKDRPEDYEKVAVMGYPMGSPLRLREGRIQSTEIACVNYGDYLMPNVRCIESYITSTFIWPGNSGSPLLNLSGEVIGIYYGGSSIISISTTLPQLKRELKISRILQIKEYWERNAKSR